MTKTRRQSGKDQADVRAAGDVIGNDDGRAIQIFEVFATNNFGMTENLGGRPDQRVINDQTRETNRFSLSPAWVVIGSAGSGSRRGILRAGQRDQFLQVGN